MQKKKSCLVIGYFNLNFGDDLFLDILFKRYKSVDFYFYPPSVLLKKYKEVFKKHKNVKFYDNEDEYRRIRLDITDETVPINLFPSILKRAEIVDFYINIGGSIFIQNQSWKNDDRYEIKKHIGNKPSFIVGCNFGPGTDEYIKYLKNWFKNFDDVCFRDKKSYDIFKKGRNIRYSDDIVISYKNRTFLPKKKSIGVSLVNVNKEKQKSYLDFHYNVLKKFLEKNYEINIYCFCENDGDLEISQLLVMKFSKVDRRNINIIRYEDINKFYRKFSRNKYLIGSRFHSIILGIINKQEIIPVLYSEKTFNYLIDLGYDFSEYYLEKLDKANPDFSDFKIIKYKKKNDKAFDKIDNYILRGDE